MKTIELKAQTISGHTVTIPVTATAIHAETGIVMVELNQPTDSQWEELSKKYQK